MQRSAFASGLAAFGSLGGLIVLAGLEPACRKGPTYDDVPIARGDRPPATKKDEPKIDYDREEVCKQLAKVNDLKSLPADQEAALREMCLANLEALKGRDRAEFDCRCKCALAAPDIGAIELCQRRCVLEKRDTVCQHAVGSQEKSNDGSVVDAARKACVARLARLETKGEARYDCTVRCLMVANGKDESLGCDDRCDPASAGKITGDAGADADASLVIAP